MKEGAAEDGRKEGALDGTFVGALLTEMEGNDVNGTLVGRLEGVAVGVFVERELVIATSNKF